MEVNDEKNSLNGKPDHLVPRDKKETKENQFIDGKWGWMVVLGSALSHFLIVGTPRSFGVFYEELLVRYERSHAETAFVIVISNTIRMIFGPITGMLCDKFGCRRIVIAGGILACIGWTMSAFSNGILYLYFTIGIIGGMGGSFTFTPAYVIVGKYFNKKKGKAMGISTVGSGLGTVVIAPLISFLLDYYSYGGAMMVVGGLMLNNLVSAALYRPVADNFPKSRSTVQEVAEGSTSADPEDETIASKLKGMFVVLKNTTFLLYCFQITAMSMCIQTFLAFLPGLALEHQVADKRKAALLLSYMGLADMAGRLLIGFPMDIPQVRYRRRFFHALIGIPMSIICVITGALTSYLAIAISSLLFGVFAGAFHSQRATIVSEFVSKSQMSSTVGWVILFQGLGNILGPPVAGALKDSTKSYKSGYYFAGASLLLTCSIFILDYLIQSRKPKKEATKNEQIA